MRNPGHALSTQFTALSVSVFLICKNLSDASKKLCVAGISSICYCCWHDTQQGIELEQSQLAHMLIAVAWCILSTTRIPKIHGSIFSKGKLTLVNQKKFRNILSRKFNLKAVGVVKEKSVNKMKTFQRNIFKK